MKRFISLILIVFALAAVLASCSGNNAAPETSATKETQAKTETSADEPTQTTATPAQTTETAEPTTETPAPTTETPAPTTETPIPTTETPAPTTETPVPTTDMPEPSTETPTVTPEPADPNVVLKGKKALFCGDSIVMASTHDKEHQWWGWAGRIKEYYGLKSCTNAGVDGASVSNCRSTNQIIKQVQNNKTFKFDFVILEGGTNDAWDVVNVGRVIPKPASETNVSEFDLSTFCGGLENLLYYAKKNYPDATIGYIITTQMNSGVGCVSEMSRYVEATKVICDKWGIPYLDLYNNAEFIKEYQPIKKRDNTPDGIHPNSSGYEIYQRYIAQFMADIYGKEFVENFVSGPLTCDVNKTLEGKTIAFYGDSLGADLKYDTSGLGYAGRIAETYGAVTTNKCVVGASISSVRADNTVATQLDADKESKYDVILINGGVYDARDSAEVGKLNDEVTFENYDESKLDLSTLAGGLEKTLYEARKNHPDSLVLFLITPKISAKEGSLGTFKKYVKLINSACEKWGVACLDLYNDGWVTATFLSSTKKDYIADGILPTTLGHDVMSTLIAEFIADEYARYTAASV